MNMGINRVSGRRGRWMFSQRGRSRSTVSAGSGPGLLCLSTNHPRVQSPKRGLPPHPRCLLSPVTKCCQNDPTFHHSLVQLSSSHHPTGVFPCQSKREGPARDSSASHTWAVEHGHTMAVQTCTGLYWLSV